MAYILAFGSHLPDRVVTNEELAERTGKKAEWIEDVSGIVERRWADEGTSVADLAAAAGRDCLLRAGIDASEVSMILVASGSAERRFPGPAASTGQRLGIAGVPAIDLPMASAGSLFGLALAANLAAVYPNILVIGAEKMSAVIEREALDPNTAILFGDGAGACLVSATHGIWQIVDSVLHSDGTASEILRLGLTGSLEMSGMQVIMQASRKFPAVVKELLERNAMDAGQIDYFVPHQANANLIARISRSLGVEESKFITNIRTRGNTSSASMLIAAAEAGAQLEGRTVCYSAFGAGLHWGALLAKPAESVTT
jgi:3-oxoacyl-[acyl-carrier-protein] synthase III